MDKKTTDIIAYLWWIGWLIAYLAGDKEGSKFHLNQSLVLWIFWTILFAGKMLPFVGGVIGIAGGIFTFVLFVIGLINACKGEDKELPLIGKIQILQ